jgi:hypothetical protein
MPYDPGSFDPRPDPRKVEGIYAEHGRILQACREVGLTILDPEDCPPDLPRQDGEGNELVAGVIIATHREYDRICCKLADMWLDQEARA